MNNAARGIIFGLFLLGSLVLLYAALVTTTADTAEGQRAVLPLALGGVACAIIASGAMSGMGSTGSPPARVTFGGRGEVTPLEGQQQAQPYAQPYGGPYAPAPQQQPGQSQPGHSQPGQQ